MEQGAQQTVKPVKDLAVELVKYIDHSNILAQRSHNYDNNVSFRNSLRACIQLRWWIEACKGSYPTHEFCRVVIHLRLLRFQPLYHFW
mgnify:CR=1 FL=1